MGVDALAIEPRWLSVTERDIAVPGLPTSMDGLRILHLSDLHLSAIAGIHARVAEEADRFDPQVIAITGDAVESEQALSALTAFVASLRGPGREIVAVVGNWERWGHVPLPALDAAYARAGATMLMNESKRLASGVAVVGVDDHCTQSEDLPRAARDLPEGPRLLLTHAPGLFDLLPPAFPAFAVALAGHTHGGQVRAFGLPLWTPPGSGRFVRGLYDTSHGPLFVSAGIGTSLLAVRFTCRPELGLFRLRIA